MKANNRLFGTDGVRGVANTELTPELAFKLGEAAVACLGKRIVIGRDTRRSGIMLESMVSAGIMSAGGQACCSGVIPTPAVAFLTRQYQADGGIVISASHNPPEYNGIKFFNREGMKLTAEQEEELEAFIALNCTDLRACRQELRKAGEGVGTLNKMGDAASRYIQHAAQSLSTKEELPLAGLRVVIDCGHGASYYTSPQAFRELGAELVVLHDDFDGMDINVNCGSTHLDLLKEQVIAHHADFGIAHDGDADRVLAVDNLGEEIDGDMILALSAKYLKDQGLLKHNRVVSTVMSNLGFQRCMEELGIELDCTKVGDKYVLESMCASGAVLGGEQSGHIIFLEHNSTGDGLITALQLAYIVKSSNKSLHELSAIMKRYPQVLINVACTAKDECDQNLAVQEALRSQNAQLAGNGRIVLRASGTEPLVRVMVEAASEELAQTVAQNLAQVVEKELN